MNKIICVAAAFIFLAACSQEKETIVKKEPSKPIPYVTVGYIVKKDEGKLLVLPDIHKEEILGKNQQGLDLYLQKEYAGEGIMFDVSDSQEFAVGEYVKVEHEMLGLSEPINGGSVLNINKAIEPEK